MELISHHSSELYMSKSNDPSLGGVSKDVLELIGSKLNKWLIFELLLGLGAPERAVYEDILILLNFVKITGGQLVDHLEMYCR